MFIQKLLLKRFSESKRLLTKQCLFGLFRDKFKIQYSSVALKYHNGLLSQSSEYNNCFLYTPNPLLIYKNDYSKGIIDKESSKEENVQYDIEINKISHLFPQPRVTLNELAAKTPDKIFDIHYKQSTVAPKGVKKKSAQNNDWLCTYSFIWPEKIKFESTAISKRQAAEKAATQALQWLHINRHIDNKGSPLYNKKIIQELQSTINKPIYVTISDSSVEQVDKIWNDYNREIKKMYEDTSWKSNTKHINIPALMKDSTIDDADCSEDGTYIPEDKDGEIEDLKIDVHPVFGKYSQRASQTMSRRQRMLKQTFMNYEENISPLPIDNYMDEITSTLENSRVAVIVGAAGCGKSTRVPAGILKECGTDTTAIVSEPRRVAAIGLAQRVADELGEEVGESVGYTVRLHSKPPRPQGGAILYCTSGVLLRRLQLNPGLEGCSHVFIDEAHERDVNTDVTLLLLKRALDLNPHLRVVVMSATLDTEVFTRYFDNCPVIEVPGRTFPVEISHLEDIRKQFRVKLPTTLENCLKEDGKPHVNCIEVAELIKAVDKTAAEGAILVFLPGWAEIKLTKQLLEQHYGSSNLHMILPVHSRLSTTEQTKMFSKPPPGVRKIVLSTNIAETSITIPDVVHVIDSGAHKENRIKEGTGTASLETVWVSQAGAKQRAGRAGRVQAGHCYKMYTKDKEAEFAPHTTPEILRIPLEQTVLDCKTYAPEDKVEQFLSQLPEPPSKEAIQFAVNDLIDLGALTPAEHLTRLGSLLSLLSLPPRLACCMLHACAIGCVGAAANVAGQCSENGEVFVAAADRREEIRDIKRKLSPTSDHAALHWLQEEFEEKLEEVGWNGVGEWCERRGLRRERLAYVKSLSNLHVSQVLDCGVVELSLEAPQLSRFSGVDELAAAVLLSGSNSLLSSRKYVSTKGKLATRVGVLTSKGERAHIGAESVNYNISKQRPGGHLLTYFGGHHSSERRALVVYKTSVVTPHTAVLFSMGNVTKGAVNGSNGETTEIWLPRHRLQIQMPTSHADLMLKTREMLWATFQYYINRDLSTIHGEDVTAALTFRTRLVKVIGRILVEAQKEYVDKTPHVLDR